MDILQQKKLFKILFWLWAITIFILSSLPNIPTQEINIWDEPFRLDYLEHFGVFFILGACYILWKSDSLGIFLFKKNIWAITGLIAFASLDELHQIWIPGRSFNLLDLIYNVLGLAIVFVLFPSVLKRISKK